MIKSIFVYYMATTMTQMFWQTCIFWDLKSDSNNPNSILCASKNTVPSGLFSGSIHSRRNLHFAAEYPLDTIKKKSSWMFENVRPLTQKHSLMQHYVNVRSKPKWPPCSLSPSSNSSSRNEPDFLADWKPFALQLAHIKKIIASFNISNFFGRETMAVEIPRRMCFGINAETRDYNLDNRWEELR